MSKTKISPRTYLNNNTKSISIDYIDNKHLYTINYKLKTNTHNNYLNEVK